MPPPLPFRSIAIHSKMMYRFPFFLRARKSLPLAAISHDFPVKKNIYTVYTCTVRDSQNSFFLNRILIVDAALPEMDVKITFSGDGPLMSFSSIDRVPIDRGPALCGWAAQPRHE